jgi:hypothetical protein
LVVSDIVQSPWQPKEDGSGDQLRDVSFTLSLNNSMGYKHSQVTETQVRNPARDSAFLQIALISQLE